MTTPIKLAEAYLLQAGLNFYRALLQVQNAQVLCEVERLESQLAEQAAEQARLQYQQTR